MACSFTGGSDEVGFIMNHVYINEATPNLVKGVIGAVNAANNVFPEDPDREGEGVKVGFRPFLSFNQNSDSLS